MAAIVMVDPKLSAAVQSLPRTPLIVVNEGSAVQGASANGKTAGDASAAQWERAVASALAELGGPEEVLEALSVATTIAEGGRTPHGQGTSAAGDTEETTAPASDPSVTRQPLDFSRSIFAEEASATLPAEDPSAAWGHFRQRCEIIANTYLLSCRESEVMYYLARGYKSSHIQQQLYISEGTAKTHIRHIYRKLDIHSQQDLIHLIDEVEL